MTHTTIIQENPLQEEALAEGLIRLRQEKTDDEQEKDNQENEMIKFSRESLHSFQFSTNIPLSRKLYETCTILRTHLKTKTADAPNHSGIKPRSRTLPSVYSSSASSSCSSFYSFQEEEETEDEQIYVPHLHNRTRQQQNQAILTTYDDFRIIITNSIAKDVLVSHDHDQQEQLIGKQVIENLIDPSYQNRLKSIIVKRRKEALHGSSIHADEGTVIVCGEIIPIIKLDGTKSSASLWLKEKKNELDQSVFIWIFEEVYESTLTIRVNGEGNMHHILDKNGLKDLYGYDTDEILNEPLSKLIPSLTPSDWKSTIQSRFFGSETKKGAHFPIIVRLLDHTTIHITSMPLIAGLMTIRFDGTIEGCNQVFARCLFGYTQDELLKKNISDLLPQFPTLFKNLNRDDLLQHGLIINNTICRKLVDHYNGPDSRLRMLTHTPNNQPLPLLIGIHRDGTPLEVQLQLKLVEEKEECALWISFDRELTFKRYGHQHLISLPPPVDERQPPPMVRSKKKEILENAILYSAQQPNATCIDDYIVIDELGQGAYGLVKVAVKKDDPEKKRVVIKYVIKSRILVDCWTSDQMLGTIPVEIHILHTLRKIPHKNISDMLDYFEDDDYYYIVMEFRETMDLFDYIEYNEQINEDNIRKIFKQIALGVKHLHDHRIVHRDIKDENVVVDKDLNVQIVDFGSAAYVKQGRKYETFVGTLDYAAPEILRGQTYSGKPQDVWALGILLFTLIYRENPFYDIDEIMSQELRIPFVLSKGSVDLICKMLERDVEKRIDIQAVLDHPWLN